MKAAELVYPVSHIVTCLTKERLGGICYFNICGLGESFIGHQAVDIARGLLGNGHLVNITNNGTQTREITRLVEGLSTDDAQRLIVSFSYHYLEIEKRHLKDVFFDNVKRVADAGASTLVQVNLTDEYMPHIDTIIEDVKKNCGAYPQLALTRKETGDGRFDYYTTGTKEDYIKQGFKFESPLFQMTVRNFNVKRKEFCYAGRWSFVLDLGTGILKPCYASQQHKNIFENPHSPIEFAPVGRRCQDPYCVNSSHFLALGVIPSIDCPSYVALRDRVRDDGSHWYTETARRLLSGKFAEHNKSLSAPFRMLHTFGHDVRLFGAKVKRRLQRYLFR